MTKDIAASVAGPAPEPSCLARTSGPDAGVELAKPSADCTQPTERIAAERFRRRGTVKVSAKTEYACIAMLELSASYGAHEPVRIRKIAEEHGIPSRFLVQILLQLKGAGLVTSTRGAAGGYQLAKAPEEITLAEV